MRRDLGRLADQEFDLLVVGGGVLGALAARDAALRGLRTALVERADFGGATSANSLRIVHGGLRYLQRLDVPRMRESIRERTLWLRLASHLVEPLPVLIPTRGGIREGRALLRLALALTELVAPGRNRGLPPERRLPPGRAVDREECLRLAPELAGGGFSGGVLFHDALFYSPERVVLATVRAAADAGAAAANHAELRSVERVRGALAVRVEDRLGGSQLVVRTRALLNAAGGGSGRVAAALAGRPALRVEWSVAMNLVARGRGAEAAIGLRAASGRFLFFVPWRGRTVIGTHHLPLRGDPDGFDVADADPGAFLEEAASTWPERLARGEILLVQAGLLPAVGPGRRGSVRLLGRPLLVDHAREGFPTAVTAVSVKFTTARRLAERAVDLVCARLGLAARSRSAEEPLPGAPTGSVTDLLGEARRRCGDEPDGEAVEHLVRSYGTAYREVLACREHDGGWSRRVVPEAPVIRAQLVYGALREMAGTPEDLVWRRTELGPRGLASPEALRTAAEVLARPERDAPLESTHRR